MKSKVVLILAIFWLSLISINAQQKTDFNYKAQKNYIPKELGKVYLGISFNAFAKELDLKNAEVGDTRFDWLELKIPFAKGNVENVIVRIHGLTQDDKKALLKSETVMKKDEFGEEYEDNIKHLDIDKIPSKGFIYALYVNFKDDFDLKTYVIRTFGKDGEIRKPDDEYYFFDIQWTKKTSDGLTWLVRSFHEEKNKSLQLLGRIDGTEWGLEN